MTMLDVRLGPASGRFAPACAHIAGAVLVVLAASVPRGADAGQSQSLEVLAHRALATIDGELRVPGLKARQSR